MRNRKEGKRSWGLRENSKRSSNDTKLCQSTNESDLSDEYEEETQINYHFRRWANRIWSVSNNVTSKLRELLGNDPSSNTTSYQSGEESCEDEGNASSWTTSDGMIESSNKINDGECDLRSNRQGVKNDRRNDTRENHHFKYGQKFNHVTENRSMRHVTANRIGTRPDFVMGHSVATYPPVLILPRLNQGVNRQSIESDSYQSRKLRYCSNYMHAADESGAYRHTGKRWDYERSHSGNNHSSLSDRRKISEKVDCSKNNPGIECSKNKSTRYSPRDRKIRPDVYGLKSTNHFSITEFQSESYGNNDRTISQFNNSQQSREKSFSMFYRDNNTRQNSNHSLESTTHTKAKKVIWDLQLSDIKSQEAGIKNPSRVALSVAQSSVMLNIAKRIASTVDQDLKATLAPQENTNVRIKDEAKEQEIAVSPTNDIAAVKHPKISLDLQSGKKISDKENDNLANVNGIKWPSVTENSVDSLLQSLRERMETLANIHSSDTTSIACNRKEESNLTKECIVASCLAGTYLPQFLEMQNKKGVHNNSVGEKEDIRPSFSDRIQDIWKDGKARVWRSSPRHRTSSFSRYNLKSDKDVSSEMSLLGLNQQPNVIREYFGEYNNAVTIARILEKLIDLKSKSDDILEAPKAPPRFTRRYSKTRVQVNVGVQKSTPRSIASSQDRDLHSRHRFMVKQRSRRNLKPRVPMVSIGRPRPLQVFSGQSIIPISSIQVTPVIQPLSNLAGLSSPLLDARSSSRCYEDTRNSTVIDDPVFQEGNPAPSMDDGLKYFSYCSNHGTSLTPHRVDEGSNELEINRQFIREQERILSLVLEKIEHGQSIAHHTDVSQQQQQHSLHCSTPVPLQGSGVVKDKADASPRGISTKGHSWWKKKFHLNKTGNLKGKMASILKCAVKKNTNDGKNVFSQNCDLAQVRNQDIVPIPPVRVKRRSNAGVIKSNKSIQWEFDGDSPCSVGKVDSFQVTELDWQLDKITYTSVTSGTNTDLNKLRETGTKLPSIGPEIIRVSKEAHSDFANELVKSILSDIVTNLGEKFETSSVDESRFDDFSVLTLGENVDSSTDSCKKEWEDPCEVTKFKICRILPSKIPLAIKRVNIFNTMSTISGKRSSTVPILENMSSHSLRSNALFGELDAGKSFFRRKLKRQDSGKKMLFKHNRSSILRVNNTLSKKYSTRQYSFSRNIFREKYIERDSIPRGSISPVYIGGERSPLNLFSVEETPCIKLVTEERSDCSKSDTGIHSEIESLPLEDAGMNNFSENHSMSSSSECGTEQVVAEKITSSRLSRVSILASKDLEHDADIIKVSISSSRFNSFEQKRSSNIETRIILEDGKSNYRNLEDAENERRLPKISASRLGPKPSSLQVREEEVARTANSKSQELDDNENTIGSSMTEKSEESPTQVATENTSPESIDLKEVERIESTKTCFSDSNASKLQSDPNSLTKNFVAAKKLEPLFVYRVEIEKLQPCLPRLTFGKTKNMPNHPDVPVQKMRAIRNQRIPTQEKLETSYSQSRTIPSSRLPRKHGFSKNGVNSARLLLENFAPNVKTVTRLSSAGKESEANISEVSVVVDQWPSEMVKKMESQHLDSSLAHKKKETVPQEEAEWTRNGKRKLTKICNTRNDINTKTIFELVRNILDMAVNESINLCRQSNWEMTDSEKSIFQRTPSRSDEPSEFSIDSLEPSCKPEIIGKVIRPVITAEIDGRYSKSRSSQQEAIFAGSYAQEQFDIFLKKAQLHSSLTSEPKIISEVITDNFQEIQSTGRLRSSDESSGKNETSDISARLNSRTVKYLEDGNDSATMRLREFCDSSEGIRHCDDKVKVSAILDEREADKNRKEVMTCLMEYYLTQSTITFDLAEGVDKREKPMLNVHLERNVEFVKSKHSSSVGKKKFENQVSSDTDRRLRMIDDENNGKSNNSGSKGSRNVKINNKALEEKVKSSIENGVPLKKITITDPSIIKHNYVNCGNSITKNNIKRDEDFKKTGSEVRDELSEKLICDHSQDHFLRDKSKGQCSHTTWDSHRNRDIIETIEVQADENLGAIINKLTSPVDQNKIIPSMTRSEPKKKPTRQRGTLIPRYKKIIVQK